MVAAGVTEARSIIAPFSAHGFGVLRTVLREDLHKEGEAGGNGDHVAGERKAARALSVMAGLLYRAYMLCGPTSSTRVANRFLDHIFAPHQQHTQRRCEQDEAPDVRSVYLGCLGGRAFQ